MRNAYIFIGPPGSGKGSLSQLCVERLGWKRLSTGDLCRKHIQNKTDIGIKIDFALKSGILVSDAIITNMVNEWLLGVAQEKCSVILDGYPRTVVQAQEFGKLLREKHVNLKLKVIKLFVSDKEVTRRISGRYVCLDKNCQTVYSLSGDSSLAPLNDLVCDKCAGGLGRRLDDAPEAIKERLRTYHQHEHGLVNFYLEAGYSVIEFNAEKLPHDVFNEFKQLICLGD